MNEEIKQRLAAVLLLLISQGAGTVSADSYANAKVGAHGGNSTINGGTGSERFMAKNPLFSLEVGYRWGDWGVEFEHISSITERDRGINMLNVTYRFW